MEHHKRWYQRGFTVPFMAIVTTVLVTVVAVVIIPLLLQSTMQGSIRRLEGAGYVVLAAGEYATINAKLDAIQTSANADYAGRITYGAGDTEWGLFTATRGGVQTKTLIVPIQGTYIPANSAVKAQLADDIGTSTLDIKISYHLKP